MGRGFRSMLLGLRRFRGLSGGLALLLRTLRRRARDRRPVRYLLAGTGRRLSATGHPLLGALGLCRLGRAGLLLGALWGLLLVWLTTLVSRRSGRGLRELVGSIVLLLRQGEPAAPWQDQKRRRAGEDHLPL